MTSLRDVLRNCTPYFVYAGIFSLITGILGLAPTFYMLTMFSKVLTSRSMETLYVLTVIFVYAIIIEAALDAVRTRFFYSLGNTVYAKLREPVLQATLHFRKAGDEKTEGVEDLDEMRDFLSGTGLKALFEIPWIPIYFWVLWLFHPILCAIAVGSATIMFGLTFLDELITKKDEILAYARKKESQAILNQSIKNVEAVSAMSMQPHLLKRWNEANHAYLEQSLLARKKSSQVVAWSKVIRNILSIASMGTAAYLVINVPGTSSGMILASTIVLGKTVAPILTVLAAWRSVISARSAYARLEELLKTQREFRKGFQHPMPEGHLSVERLLFFLSRDRTILNGIHFQLEAGESLGIIGSSAAGKTSLARLLVGIYKPSDGVVRLDGADVHQWSQNGLGDYIGYLPQDQQLFAGSVAENIARMGDPYEFSGQVIEAAKRAGIHDMILRLPKGYDTEIGAGGSVLSGGQRQLIGLARALFGRPSFVVLDEPNSNLDGESELILLEVIRRLKSERVTLVVITHKPSLLQDVDKLLVLGQSKQIMFGPYPEIMKRLGYASGVVPASASLTLESSAAP